MADGASWVDQFFNSQLKLFMSKLNLIFLSTVLLGCGSLQAQLQKGNVLVGGDITSMDLTLNSSKAFTINIDPKAAWFIKDNLAVGAYVNFGLSTAKGQGTSTTYGVGALARYYFSSKQVDILKSTRFFVEANAGIEGSNAAQGGGSTNGLGLGIGPGIAYFVSPNVSLEALLKFKGIVGFGSDVATNDIVLGVGFQIYLPNKKVKQLMNGKM
jgi:hypothetical protein